MYIQKAEIKNIRSIIDFEIEFPNPAGWHVLIGDNGAGKSTIIRSMALSLIGEDQIQGLRANWENWLNIFSDSGVIKSELLTDEKLDEKTKGQIFSEISLDKDNYDIIITQTLYSLLNIKKITDYESSHQNDTIFLSGVVKNPQVRHSKKGNRFCLFLLEHQFGATQCLAFSDVYEKYSNALVDGAVLSIEGKIESNEEGKNIILLIYDAKNVSNISNLKTQSVELRREIRFSTKGMFSVAYGPYRRFEGGSSRWDELFKNSSFERLAAHLSVFGEDVALTEVISWLKDLNYKSLEENKESRHTLKNLKKLINSKDFLPHNAQLESISSDGVFFKDGNGTTISVNQMSDGYRSVLSMTFELIRQLVRVYGSELVFKNIEQGEMKIDLPGVVLVDEIDAHLHPTWQTRIGQWFLKYFPRLQFIVTTHSPLVCRAAEKGSIWRLAAPGSEEKSGEIMGLDRERLIYGNILDAYGTEVFGANVDISKESVEKQETLAKLSKKKMLDDISPEEEEKLENLKKVFTTDAPIEL